MKKQKFAMLSFDVEPDLHTLDYKGITEGIPQILKIFDKNNVKATFFITCDCLEKYPFIFRNLIKKGHEVAWHGYRHERFDDLTKQGKEESIKKSLVCFKKYLNISPKGFRAVQHSSDSGTFSLLEKNGFSYDSSRTPLNILQFIFFPKRIKRNFADFFSNPFPHKIGKIIEIPTSSFLMPFVSLVPRVFPVFLQRIYLALMSIFYRDLVFYAHSWDFIKTEGSKIDQKFPHERIIKNLELVIAALKRKGFKLIKMQDYQIK